MSLLEESMEECALMDKTTKPDGDGGVITAWKDGAHIMAAIVFNTSMEARAAEQQGVTSLYTVTTGRKVVMQYHDVFRRLRDGKIFRVTSDGDDKFTPKSARLDIRQVSAEEWVPA